MTDYLPFIITGLTSGSVYALAALGLVLTQRTAGVFNFAHGAVAAVGAFAFYGLWEGAGIPYPVALAIVLAIVAPLVGYVLEAVSRSLGGGSRPVMQVVATVGILLVIQGSLTLTTGALTRQATPFLPTGMFRLAGTNVGVDQLVTVLVTAAAALGLTRLLARTRIGIAMRGVVDDADLISLSGTDPVTVRRVAWVIGCAFAALSGILIAPFLGLDVLLLTLLVVQAFGAAAVGRFSSLGLTYAGGLGLGVAVALSTKFVAEVPALRGLPSSLPFLVLFGVLVAFPRRLPRTPPGRAHIGGARTASPLVARVALVAGCGVLIVLPHLAGARIPMFLTGGALALLFLSLGLLVWTAGQVSLCHAVFVAVGGTTMAHLTAGAGLPWFAALLVSGLVAVPVGAVVAIPAIRLSGVYLALATFGFGILVEQLLYPSGLMFGALGFRLFPRPALPGLGAATDVAYFYVVVAVVVVAAVWVRSLLRSRLGRVLRAVSDAPLAVTTHGASVNVALTIVFCVSAFLAAVAGGLLGGVTGSISSGPLGPFQSLTWLAVLTIAGRSPLAGAIGGALLLGVLPGYVGSDPAVQTVTFGAVAIVAAVLADSEAARSWFAARAEASRWRLDASPVRARLEDLQTEATA
ncbi:MAG: ABC transporter permease [Actinobacteria bacterium]|nr:ABC transporter permease [Actinomycetota bacterium]